ncbi:MAG: heavy metal-associated domain-containing protein [Pedobacter sp.]|nr:heavy metal-associated domain-containing protein [Pedobacter sp.]MDQ8052485.1 heavy metal-associated domain-containing protein [Pedobacter sp.]
MTHTYQLTGMTCGSCESKVKSSLLLLPDILAVEVSKDSTTATITMEKHVGLGQLQRALGGKNAKYQISTMANSVTEEGSISWLKTYRPVLLLFAYMAIVSFIASWQDGQFDVMHWMQFFMAGFFLAFSFFKFLNLQAFAESYARYDILAKRLKIWAYAYAFVELALGMAYATNFNPGLTNWITLIVMLLSSIGVIRSVLGRQKIQCACLGAVFDLPMSTLTIIEDLLMIVMSAFMLTLL